jgi:predicted PurR-regulated permease PerM
MEDMWTFARRVALVTDAAVAVIAAWLLTDVLLVLFAGVLFAVMLTGPAILLTRYTGITRGWALGIVIFALLALVGAGTWFTGREIVGQFESLRESVQANIQDWHSYAQQQPWGKWLNNSQAAENVAPAGASMAGHVTGLLSSIFTGLTAAVVVVALGIYIAIDPGLYKHGALHLFPPEKRSRVRQILEALWVTLNGWLIGRFFSMLVIGIGTGLGLWMLGMPMALALGLLAFSVTFVPYVGPILSALPAVLVASSMGSSQLLWVIALYGGLQFIETYLLTPLVEHRTVSVPPALSIGAQLAGGVLLGPLGLVLATPLAAVAMVLVKMLYVEDTLGEPIPAQSKE